MTEGHKHRLLTVRRGGLVYRVLRTPLLHFNAPTGSDRFQKLSDSAYPYGLCPRREGGCLGHRNCYVLTPLGILHRWTGLTLYWTDEQDEGVPDERPGGRV